MKIIFPADIAAVFGLMLLNQLSTDRDLIK